MFWMARGGGGLFPGIVTKFTARARPKPQAVLEAVCYLPLGSLEDAIEVWLQYLDEYNNPARKMFSDLTADRNAARIEWNCWGCNQAETAAYEQIKETTKSQIAALLPGGVAALNCENGGATTTYTWEQKLLSRTWDTYSIPSDLVSRPEWPEWFASSGENLAGAGMNGSFLVPNDYDISRALINTLGGYLRASPGEGWERASKDSLLLYPMARNNAAATSTAYGGRDAKLVIHYKHDRIDTALADAYRSHVSVFENTLATQYNLPCRGFYNYGDSDMACAPTDDAWLAAFFSDPTRVRNIVQTQDPNGVFYRQRLQ
uniref:Berberine/berberine-like domain-containing protein n=1 Tax=Amphora coffeiformis TaxID=265554 RepID=A0A7S3PCI4_9STRA